MRFLPKLFLLNYLAYILFLLLFFGLSTGEGMHHIFLPQKIFHFFDGCVSFEKASFKKACVMFLLWQNVEATITPTGEMKNMQHFNICWII